MHHEEPMKKNKFQEQSTSSIAYQSFGGNLFSSLLKASNEKEKSILRFWKFCKMLSSSKKKWYHIELEYKDEPKSMSLGNIKFDAVRIPHAGWPQRAGISNLVFRVTLNNATTVVHMGDADPNDVHFKPLIAHWNTQHTNTAFPPYWFMTSENGQLILKERINADHNIAVHVPMQVPDDLIKSGEKYFSTPGEKSQLIKIK